ncbi:50S ribosomal protein L14e [Methanothermococcus sp. SCGC AD-155-M21]|nr:50S ribosomal protein L14e [Methanothermococcus sp. SCGC AD-155-M21]
MSAIEVGTVCVKTLGREAGKTCVIVDIVDKNFVLIDGNVKRRRCNIKHIEPTDKKIDIEKGASTEEVRLALDTVGLL